MPWGMLEGKGWIADDWDSDETNAEIARSVMRIRFFQENEDSS